MRSFRLRPNHAIAAKHPRGHWFGRRAAIHRPVSHAGRTRITGFASLLEGLANVPVVAAELALIQELQTEERRSGEFASATFAIRRPVPGEHEQGAQEADFPGAREGQERWFADGASARKLGEEWPTLRVCEVR